MQYVSDESNELARVMERKFTTLPAQAGVIFASVEAKPTDSGVAGEFWVRLGIQRRLTEDAGKALIAHMLSEEMKSGLKIFASVYRGIPGACRDDHSSAARPNPS